MKLLAIIPILSFSFLASASPAPSVTTCWIHPYPKFVAGQPITQFGFMLMAPRWKAQELEKFDSRVERCGLIPGLYKKTLGGLKLDAVPYRLGVIPNDITSFDCLQKTISDAGPGIAREFVGCKHKDLDLK